MKACPAEWPCVRESGGRGMREEAERETERGRGMREEAETETERRRKSFEAESPTMDHRLWSMDFLGGMMNEAESPTTLEYKLRWMKKEEYLTTHPHPQKGDPSQLF